MNTASNGSFRNLKVVVECCNKDTSLNELCYKWDAGFSRFSIEIMNPMNELTKENMEYIGKLMNFQLRKVVAYY
jgi:hypothetical protein